ncbi:hypothetical protein [Nisaea denitrificans]|uniref:hypothetical protein n=1 Tax=Nisaea denitrificans TaxID=390877 RepID=UPI00048E3CDD|nr:hypothetical protein [Nisaea denitrificans]
MAKTFFTERRLFGQIGPVLSAVILGAGVFVPEVVTAGGCSGEVNGIRGAEINLYADEGLTQKAAAVTRSDARGWRKAPLCLHQVKSGVLQVSYDGDVSKALWGRKDELKVKLSLVAGPDSLGSQGVGANRGLGAKK